MPIETLRGIFPIVATTFHEDGSIDFESQERLLHHLLESGAYGLGLFGNASEGYTLFGRERAELLQLTVRVVNGRVPVVVSTGHTGTDAAVALSKEAEELGASAVMVLPPYYLKPDAAGLAHYFEAIARAIGIPVMVQDAPLMTQVSMPAALLAKLAQEIERVAYVKVEAPPTAPKISQVLAASAGRLICFGGLNGQFMIEEYGRGARGFMPGSDMTSIYVRLWNLLESGDVEEAWRLFSGALPLMRFELQPGMGVSAMKHNLVARGVIRSVRVRHPTTSLNEDSLRELAVLRRLAACD